MKLTNALTASLEDYLETIFHIIREKQAVRPKDIARRLGVSNSSVTGALHSLAEKKLINYAPFDVITLTTPGAEAARDIIRRHEALRDFFISVLAVNPDDADDAACRMEHSIPRIILERFIQFAEFVEVCPKGGAKWIAGFGYHCDRGATPEKCAACITVSLDEVSKKKTKGENQPMLTVRLKDLKPGQKGKVLHTLSRGEVGKRIVEMGVTPGALIEVERIAPLGDPIDVKVKGYHLSLRKEEAAGIDVEIIS